MKRISQSCCCRGSGKASQICPDRMSFADAAGRQLHQSLKRQIKAAAALYQRTLFAIAMVIRHARCLGPHRKGCNSLIKD
jgi:hypothetical protein